MIAAVVFLVLIPLAWAGVRAAVRALTRLLLGPPEAGSRRERYANASKTVAKGVASGALAATLVFPTVPNTILALYATYVDSKTHPVLATDFLQLIVAEAGVSLLLWLMWCVGILLLIPVWSALSGFWRVGPKTAALLGTCAASSMAALADPWLGFLSPLVLSAQGLLVVVVGSAGALGGATVWWTAYRPQVVRSRLRKCPVLGQAI